MSVPEHRLYLLKPALLSTKNKHTQILGPTWCQWMVPRTSAQSLLLLQNILLQNSTFPNHRHHWIISFWLQHASNFISWYRYQCGKSTQPCLTESNSCNSVPNIGNRQMTAIKELATIFNNITESHFWPVIGRQFLLQIQKTTRLQPCLSCYDYWKLGSWQYNCISRLVLIR